MKYLAVRVLSREFEIPDNPMVIEILDVFFPIARVEAGFLKILPAYRTDDAVIVLKVAEIRTRIIKKRVAVFGIGFPERVGSGLRGVAESFFIFFERSRCSVSFVGPPGERICQVVDPPLYLGKFVLPPCSGNLDAKFAGADGIQCVQRYTDLAGKHAPSKIGEDRPHDQHDQCGPADCQKVALPLCVDGVFPNAYAQHEIVVG